MRQRTRFGGALATVGWNVPFEFFGLSLVGIQVAPTPVTPGLMLLGFGLGFGLIMPLLDTTATRLASG